ncbi:endonuclease domain-containing protein [Paludisphaera mucosa]|uniref:DUF559 domain-containing protein n=1 Tax=Paludisphaera mucosa TaxID=3030827 RepID=A0ABT6FB99_9BACT|nr:DUF559 domain-containing protein [Paludisphaera mucosa]MDG3004821.1 DUF559 domain-containing protein [Paludisphaera mucosa]
MDAEADDEPDPSISLDRARELRRNMTGPERTLWRELRRLGMKFRRQVPMGPFYVDFYEPARRLVIELDGDSHVGRADYDLARQEWLGARHVCIFRVSNDDVIQDVATVVEAIIAFGRRSSDKPG